MIAIRRCGLPRMTGQTKSNPQPLTLLSNVSRHFRRLHCEKIGAMISTKLT